MMKKDSLIINVTSESVDIAFPHLSVSQSMDESFDFIVVGNGTGAKCAALKAVSAPP